MCSRPTLALLRSAERFLQVSLVGGRRDMTTTPTLIEIAPGLFRVRKDAPEPPKSDLPMPNVISDTMPPTEQVNGKFYESKSAFRRVGRQLGLTEVGNEKPKPRP